MLNGKKSGNSKEDEPTWLTGIGLLFVLCGIVYGSYSCISGATDIRKCREFLTNLSTDEIVAIQVYNVTRFWQRGELIIRVSEQDSIGSFIESLHKLRTASYRKPAIKKNLNIGIVRKHDSDIELHIGLATQPKNIARFTMLIRGDPEKDDFIVKDCGSFESENLFNWLSKVAP